MDFMTQNGATMAPESDLESDVPAMQSNMFRHIAFVAGLLLVLGAWKFGIESLLE